jgi:hypothetical protein
MSTQGEEFQRDGFVSVWVGTFPSVEEAEAYFGIPDEIGVDLPPEGMATDLGLSDLPAESLEVNFEQLAPRPLAELLKDATYSASFREQAVGAAKRQGIQAAQGIALLYDFDYQPDPEREGAGGPLTFIGSFPYVRTPSSGGRDAVPDPRIEVKHPKDYLGF